MPGLAGSVVPSACSLKAKLGILPTFVPYTELQKALAALTGANVHPFVPWLLSFVNGSLLLGPLFNLLEPRLPGGSGFAKGLYFGFLGWLLVSLVFLPMIGLGLFGANASLGVWPAVMMLAMLLIYGSVTGAVSSWLRWPTNSRST